MKRSGPFLLLVVFLVASFAQPAFALYKWVDDKGILHITDYPPPSKEPAPEPETPKPTAPVPSPAPAPASSSVPVASATSTLLKTGQAVTTAASKPSTTAVQATKPSGTAVSAPVPATIPSPSPAAPAAPRKPVPVPQAGIMALVGGFMMIFALVGIAVYVYFSLCMYLIAKKLNVAEAWMSWVPILNLWPFLTSAGKPCWWVVLLFIPLVNIIVMVYLWICISENLGRNKWLGLLILVPIVSLILPGILAFSKNE